MISAIFGCFFSRKCQSGKSALFGKHLRVSAYGQVPFVYYNQDMSEVG